MSHFSDFSTSLDMANRESALRLKGLGVDVKIIAQATGLSVEEIEKL